MKGKYSNIEDPPSRPSPGEFFPSGTIHQVKGEEKKAGDSSSPPCVKNLVGIEGQQESKIFIQICGKPHQ